MPKRGTSGFFGRHTLTEKYCNGLWVTLKVCNGTLFAPQELHFQPVIGVANILGLWMPFAVATQSPWGLHTGCGDWCQPKKIKIQVMANFTSLTMKKSCLK